MRHLKARLQILERVVGKPDLDQVEGVRCYDAPELCKFEYYSIFVGFKICHLQGEGGKLLRRKYNLCLGRSNKLPTENDVDIKDYLFVRGLKKRMLHE